MTGIQTLLCNMCILSFHFHYLFIGVFVIVLVLLLTNYVHVVCRRQIEALNECSVIYIDGTFKTAPKPYHQIVTINGLYKGNSVPLVFALCTTKQIGVYRQILQVLIFLLYLYFVC